MIDSFVGTKRMKRHAGRIRPISLALVLVLMVLGAAGPSRAQSEYVLGMSAAFTGPSHGLGIELYRGSAAYFNQLNAQGGVNGSPVRIVTLDDGYQPDPAVENTIELMQHDEVLCLFDYVGTPTVTRVLPLLKGYSGRRKLLFFPFTGAEPQRNPPYGQYVFNLRASYRQELAELTRRFVRLGRKRVAVFYQADAYGRSGWDGARRALDAFGLTLVGEATYRRGTLFESSMAQQVEIIKRSHPDVVISIGAYAACAAFIRDARRAGLDVPIANVSFVGSENMLDLLEDVSCADSRDYTINLVNTQVVPSYEDTTLPAVREYRKLMESMDISLPKVASQDYRPFNFSFASFEGFLNAKAMALILREYTRRPGMGLAYAAESLGEFDLGLDVPVSFGPDKHQGLDKVYFTTVWKGTFVPMTEEQWGIWQK